MINLHLTKFLKMKYVASSFLFAVTLCILYFPACTGTEMPRNITCTIEQDCLALVNASLCNGSICYCPDTLPIFVNATTDAGNILWNITELGPIMSFCLPSLNLSESGCLFKQQCTYVRGDCIDNVCRCQKYYEPENGKTYCIIQKPNMLIPIIVGGVLALLILSIIAVYLCRRKYSR